MLDPQFYPWHRRTRVVKWKTHLPGKKRRKVDKLSAPELLVPFRRNEKKINIGTKWNILYENNVVLW